MKPVTKRDLGLLLAIILVGALALAGVFLGLAARSQPAVPDEVVVLPKLPDDIVALGYESHFTGMFVQDFMGAEEQTAISCTAGCVITPTGTYQPLESAGNVTCTLEIAGALGRYTGVRDSAYTVGSLLWLKNESDTTIVINEGGTADLTGTSVSLGISDTLLLFFDSTWIELSESNN